MYGDKERRVYNFILQLKGLNEARINQEILSNRSKKKKTLF